MGRKTELTRLKQTPSIGIHHCFIIIHKEMKQSYGDTKGTKKKQKLGEVLR